MVTDKINNLQNDGPAPMKYSYYFRVCIEATETDLFKRINKSMVDFGHNDFQISALVPTGMIMQYETPEAATLDDLKKFKTKISADLAENDIMKTNFPNRKIILIDVDEQGNQIAPSIN